MPTKAPQDPDGVLASLPKDVQANYNLYGTPVLASAWANWKPKHPAPYKVGILWQPPINAFVKNTHDALVKTLKDSGEVDIVADLAPQSPTDVPGSLQEFGQIVAKKPDLIIVFPLAPEPFVEPINKAGAAGIPVVTAVVLGSLEVRDQCQRERCSGQRQPLSQGTAERSAGRAVSSRSTGSRGSPATTTPSAASSPP